jgi:sulfur carrier protein
VELKVWPILGRVAATLNGEERSHESHHPPPPSRCRYAGNRRVRDLLQELQINPETVLVVRGEDLLTPDELIKDEETVEVVPAISGGSTSEV